MDLDQYVLKTMFEKSLFSDLSLAFFHESFPFTMRFDVHKAVVAQSPFFRLLLENTHRLTTVDTAASTDHPMDSQQTSNDALHLTIDLIEAMTRHGFIMTPSQHIIRRQWQKQAAPLNETPLASSSSSEHKGNDSSHQTRHILGSHLRFALKWMYSMDRGSMVDTLQDEDTLRVLCVAVLFGLDALVDDCLERYTTQQLSIDAITDDLETICQLPRDHKAYHQLRDAALLLLLRFGPQYPRHLARLPVDYMSDVLSVDLLYIGCEYERYCLLREVLVAYMQSVGKITWTPTGPVDQDFKRLSGFVRNPLLTQQGKQQQGHHLSASDVRLSSRKRKRIPSEELVHIGGAEQSDSGGGGVNRGRDTSANQRLTRLSFSACVPFEKLVADASSGGVIDKATILSYLLRTTVNYSNMTFDQLAIVRQDVIVDESIVFRALWQREELERLLFPFNYQQSQQMPTFVGTAPASSSGKTTQHTIIPRFGKMGNSNNGGTADAMDRRAALDEYFDVGDVDGKGKRRRMLLGTPRFRFCASVPLVLPETDDNDDGNDDCGWDIAEFTSNFDVEATATSATATERTQQTTAAATAAAADDPSSVFDDDDDDDDDDNDSIWVCEDEKDTLDSKHATTEKDTAQSPLQNRDHHTLERLTIGERSVETTAKTTEYSGTRSDQAQPQRQQQQQQNRMRHWIYNKTIYSDAEYILGHRHRVRVEVQLLPRSLVQSQEESGSGIGSTGESKVDQKGDDNVIVCRFELQRDNSVGTDNMTSSQQHGGSSQQQHASNAPDGHRPDSKLSPQQQTKIRYDIYCLNRHQVLDGNNHVDPEDKVLVPVSKVTEAKDAAERSASYVKQVVLNMDALDDKKKMDVDMVVALEIFGFQKM